jgi:tagaturonate reductase
MGLIGAPADTVLQFGTSRFLQAHADLFLDEAAAGPVTVVASSGGAAGLARARAFNDPAGYPVIIRGLVDGQPVQTRQQVHVVTRGLSSEEDWPEVLRIAATKARCVISNTTEAGLVAGDETIDLRHPEASVPPSFPGKLLACLASRYGTGADGLTIFPTELVARNGVVLETLLREMAQRNGATPSFLDWMAARCVFANSLVDRIVSESLEPIGAVAEPYALWAIERRPNLVPPCTHPAIRIVDELEPFQRLKVHILNLGHTVLAQTWLDGGWAGETTVLRMLADDHTRTDLLSLYHDEVLPGFAVHGLGPQAEAYLATTLGRFDNPFLAHRVADIAQGHIAKLQSRIGAFIAWAEAAGAPAMPRLKAIAARAA